MNIVKLKINKDTFNDSDTIYVRFSILQEIKDLGITTDLPQNVVDIKGTKGTSFVFMKDTDSLVNHFAKAGRLEYYTDSKLYDVKTYNREIPYKVNLDVKTETYINYQNDTVKGVDRVTKIDNEEYTYVKNAQKDNKIGTENQQYGMVYTDNPIEGIDYPDTSTNMTTKSSYNSEGWNKLNSDTYPEIKEEYLYSIISPPEVYSEVFIDRKGTSVLDRHTRLAESKTLDQLIKYNNGYYNTTKTN